MSANIYRFFFLFQISFQTVLNTPKFYFSGAKWGRDKKREGRKIKTGDLLIILCALVNELLSLAPATESSGNHTASVKWEVGRNIFCPA